MKREGIKRGAFPGISLHALLVASLAAATLGCELTPLDIEIPLNDAGPPPPNDAGPPPPNDAGPEEPPEQSDFLSYQAPAGKQPTAQSTLIDGFKAAILPNGRLITPAGVEVSADAPKPFGLALAPDGSALAVINSGAARFSVTFLRDLTSASPLVSRVDVDATFMGLAFSPDSARFYAAGGDNGNIWIGDVAKGAIVGSVNLNGPAHPLESPLNVKTRPQNAFKGAFPGNMAVSNDGRYLYVVDQAGFQVFVLDTTKIGTGVDAEGKIIEPNNFAAIVGQVKAGRYPFGITLSPDGSKLFITNVGIFEFTHLGPESPTGDKNEDYPLCFPGAGYPGETEQSRTITIKKIDATTISGLPVTLRDPDGIRCGYVSGDQEYTVPGLGSPNVPESSSVYAFDLTNPEQPALTTSMKTGLLVGDIEHGIPTYSGSHPNAVAAGKSAVYVSNGNNDSISILDPTTLALVREVSLSFLEGFDERLKGIQPVALALSPDETRLYVAEAGLNAIAVLAVDGEDAEVIGRIPAGWWPSSVKVSADGKTLYVANAKGRGAGPNAGGGPEDGHPKYSVLGTVQIIPVPDNDALVAHTERVMKNNGFAKGEPPASEDGPIPAAFGAPSKQIKHVILINKENLTHDQALGDVLNTRKGVPVEGDPTLALDADATPNHHELALQFAFSDNFYLEPTVSSDGHRWLTNTYTTEFEETHWPASYGGRRRDSGDAPEIIKDYPGRLGFTDACGSPDPHDYNQHGGIYMHLVRHGLSFTNFGNGYEFAIVDEDKGTEPTGIRQHVNIPMEEVVRNNTDHLFPEFNMTIPDAPLPENPDRFNRFGRFKQVFEAHYVDSKTGECKLPSYIDLYYPTDHGGGANDINGPAGPPWDFKRYVQDNDAALGLTVELIANSPCWKDTVIFVTEDDTQNGLDHVDGYRTLLMAISPWAKREYVSKTHASLASVFKTIHLILGLPPLNLYDAAATELRDMFTGTPDFTPYKAQSITYARKANPRWARLTAGIDFKEPDAEEVSLREAILKSEGLPRKVIKAEMAVLRGARRAVPK